MNKQQNNQNNQNNREILTKQKREKDETCLEESFWFEQIREIIHFGVPVLCTIESVHRAREGIDRDDKELIRK